MRGDTLEKMKNNSPKIIYILCIISLCSSCSVNNALWNIKLKYLIFSPDKFSSDKGHIELGNMKKLILSEKEFLPFDDRDLMAKLSYKREDRIALLKEYFFFQGYKEQSNKEYAFHIGTSKNKAFIVKEKIPVPVEALYSLSIMLLDYNVSISPVLINKNTGRVSNGDEKEMKEIFDIYKTWFYKMEKSGFNEITWPLENSKYEWLGRKEVKIVLRSSL